MSEEERELPEGLKKALGAIHKDFGDNSVVWLNERAKPMETISSGSIMLDRALGVGGYAKGRIVEIFGAESGGKSTLALHAVANAQAQGGYAAYIDTEHALDPAYATAGPGVDIDSLLISQPDTAEEALEIMNMLARSGDLAIIVLDSVAALVPRAELEGESGDSHVGLHARLMSQHLRRIAGIIEKTGTVAVFINQLREKIGVSYGPSTTTSGGRALRFYASQRLEVTRIEAVKDGVEVVGAKTRVKVVKNKVAPPFKQALLEIHYGRGVANEMDLIDLGAELGWVQKGGAWLTFPDDAKIQGRLQAGRYLREHPDLMADLTEKILAGEVAPRD